MPNLRDKTWTPTTPAQTADAQFWEDHLIDDASYEGLQEILEGGGGGGHVIQNPSGTEMPQQPVLQFINATVTNGEGKTIVSGNGEKGDAATVAVGTVTTGAAGTNAQVTNSGTQYDAVLDFVIPRGADGNGLPSGGSNGQVLYKDTSASTGGSWGDLPESVLSVSGKTPDAQGNVDIDASDVALGSGTVETLAGSIATIETSPATANHSVGEYIVYNGQLYKVTTAITAGNSLTVGTNISAVSVGAELRKINTGTEVATTSHTLSFAKSQRIGNLYVANLTFTVGSAVSAWTTLLTLNNVRIGASCYFLAYIFPADIGGTSFAILYVGTRGQVSCISNLSANTELKVAISLILND